MKTLAVVAIDGPAGTGKSTVAKLVAERLGFTYIDTGAMYRALTLKVLKAGVSPDDETLVAKTVSSAEISLEGSKVNLDGADVTKEIRSGRVTRTVSKISKYAAVRSTLLARQRAFARGGRMPSRAAGAMDGPSPGTGRRREGRGVVMEGRDIGTVVFPEARWKFFLDADAKERARRRQRELEAAGNPKKFEWVLADIVARDKEDRERPIAPLKPAEGAAIVDTTRLTIAEVVERIAGVVEKQRGK